MDSVVRDVRYAARGLRRSPGFLVTAVLTLGLGIGATATMYSVVHDVLLAPLPYPESDRLVGIGFRFPVEKPAAEQTGGTAEFVRDHAKSFESVGIADDSSYGMNLSGLGGGARPARVETSKVSAGFFPTLGVRPVLGRIFGAEEDVPGGPKVAMLSYWVWQRMFGGDQGVVGKTIRLNEEPYTVIGVLPEVVSNTGEAPDVMTMNAGVWLPSQMSKKDPGYDGDNYVMVGRLRQGVSLEQAQRELDSLNAPMYEAFPGYKEWMAPDGHGGKMEHMYRAWPLRAVLVSDVRQSLLVLLSAVAAVLLVACLNLAGLMTARASTRTRELALRTALGATRSGLLRLLVSESLILAVVGGALGLGMAQVAKPVLVASAPMAIQTVHGAGGWSVVAVVVGMAFLTTLVCGLLPGWTVFRQDAQAALKGGQGAGANVAQVRVGKGLMVGQVAVSMVLLSAASLLLGSFLKLQAVPSGVVTKRLSVAQVLLKGDAYATTLHSTQFVEKVLGVLGQYPGVTGAAAVNGLPLDNGLNIGGRPMDQPNLRQTVEFRAVTPGYFRTMGVAVMEGLEITAEDRAKSAPVAMVSATAAKRWWPGKSAIGQRVVFGKTEIYTVVGVASDVHSHSLAEKPGIVAYVPFEQMSDPLTKIVNGWFPTTFVIRAAGDVDVAAAVAKAVGGADAEMPVAKISTMESFVDKTVAGPRFFSWLAGGFAGFALLLTVIGLFGLLSYQVTQRTREIGVRIAIGAGRGEILRLILGRGMVLTSLGLVAGGLMSLAVPKVVGSVLEDVVNTGGGPVVGVLSSSSAALGCAGLAMLMAAGLASWLPARRAAAVEPVEALRSE